MGDGGGYTHLWLVLAVVGGKVQGGVGRLLLAWLVIKVILLRYFDCISVSRIETLVLPRYNDDNVMQFIFVFCYGFSEPDYWSLWGMEGILCFPCRFGIEPLIPHVSADEPSGLWAPALYSPFPR